jgi:hypothetical protein
MPADRPPILTGVSRAFYPAAIAACFLALVTVFPAASCRAQTYAATVLPAPDLRLTLAGDVKAIIRQSDGKLVVGGGFDLVDRSLHTNLARFNADGSLDSSWTVDADGVVNALAVDGNDNVYVGGSFGHLGGVTRNALGKVAANGVVDASWNPAPNSIVTALRVSGGQIYVAGGFTAVGGTPRTGVARVSSSGTGALDLVWNPAPNGSILTLLEVGSSLYLGGSFSQVGGTPRIRLAKVSTLGTGALDASWNPSADAGVNALANDSTGKIIVGGLFFNVGGLARNCIARLDPAGSGAADPTWIAAGASTGCTVRALAADGNGAILAGGGFSTIGGQSRNNLARLLDSGSVDTSWNPDVQAQLYLATAGVHAVLPLPGGGTQIGGVFDTVGGGHSFGSARLAANGSRDGSFTAALDVLGEVRALAIDPVSGLTYVGGNFGLVDGSQVRRNLLRLAADLTLDAGWTGSVSGSVHALLVDAAQRVYAGGSFSRSDLTTRNNLARFDSNGVLDATWDPNPNFGVEALAATPDGTGLYLGGGFSQVGGQPRNRLARVATTGTGNPPDAWNPNANSSVLALAVRPGDGAVYAGGAFTMLGTSSRGFVGKIGSDGTVDPAWNPNLNNVVEALAVDPRPAPMKRGSAGSIGVGGDFTLDAGVAGLAARNGLVNVLADGPGLFDPLQDSGPPSGSRITGLGAYPTSVFTDPLNWITGSIPEPNGPGDRGLIIFDANGNATLGIDLFGNQVIYTSTAHYYFIRRGETGTSSSLQPAILLGGRMSQVDGQQRIGLAAIALLPDRVFLDGFE